MADNTDAQAAQEKIKDTKQKQSRKMVTSTVKDVISKGKTMTGSKPDQIDINPVRENAELFKLVSDAYDKFHEDVDRKDTHKREWGTDSLTNIFKGDTPGQQDRKDIDLVPRDPTSDRTKDKKFFRQQAIVKRKIDVDEAFNDVFESEVWDKPNPKKTHKTLSPDQKARAKARAKAAGRPYPNLVDNMAVAKEDINNAFDQEMVNEISAELVGKVNKMRWLEKRPSKTKAASQTLSLAVRKAWLKSKVGVVKE